MALPVETPSRIWRRIEEGEACDDMPSLPSLPQFDASGLNDSAVDDNISSVASPKLKQIPLGGSRNEYGTRLPLETSNVFDRTHESDESYDEMDAFEGSGVPDNKFHSSRSLGLEDGGYDPSLPNDALRRYDSSDPEAEVCFCDSRRH